MWLIEKETHTGTRWVRAWFAALCVPIVAAAGFLVGTVGGGSAKVPARSVAAVSPAWTQTETATQPRSVTTPAKAVTVTAPTQTVVRTVTTQSATSSGGQATGNPSSPAAQGGGAGSLTTSQVRAAENGATAMSKVCLDESAGNWSAAKADLKSAVAGEFALKDALNQDPDTRYHDFTAGRSAPPVTMRQMAAMIASDAGDGGACGAFGQDMQTALNGLPH